ncbi:MAG: transglycosylase domain-containing protein [Aquisalinus sp.]|nr:transglycosylase domain-containing protein [Aquisalinus sp.]
MARPLTDFSQSELRKLQACGAIIVRALWQYVRHPGKLIPGKKAIIAFAICAALLVAPLAVGVPYMNALLSAPLPERTPINNTRSVIFYDTNGDEIGIRGAHRRAVSLEELPDHTIAAFIAIEDRRFFNHLGVDPIGILRALKSNYEAGHIVEGGSTITQQLVKNTYLDPAKTVSRKMQEAIIALQLERRWSKERILEEYLYTVYFGNNAYGIEAAAESYFGKKAADLSIAESALLAGCIKAPGRNAPHIALQAARNRGHLVLDAMIETGELSLIEGQLAHYELDQLEILPPKPEPRGYFLDHAVATLTKVDSDDILHVETTLDPAYQSIAHQALEKVLTPSVKKNSAVSEAALIAMRPNGEIVAMVGGLDYTKSQFNRATQAMRQPGSLFKVFVYDAALRQGWHHDDILADSPLSLAIPGKSELYQPTNYNNAQRGLLTTRQAFATSSNAAALRLQEWVGRGRVIEAAKRAGFDTDLETYPSLALGVTETTLLDLVSAYASIGKGYIVEPYVHMQNKPRPALIRSAPSADLLQLMYDNVQAGTGYGARINQPSFGKTGTTQDHRDAWYIGFTDELIVGVWLGNDDYTPMNKVTGGSLPASIWKTFMTAAAPVLAQETSSPKFQKKPLLEIAQNTRNDDQPFSSWREHKLKLIGPATISEYGYLSVVDQELYLEHIQPVSPYGSYYSVHQEMTEQFQDIEVTCELVNGYASCRAGDDNLAEMLLEKGWARTLYGAPSSYLAAESNARDKSLGIWGDDLYTRYATYERYDMRGLSWRQRLELEQQRRRENDRLERERRYGYRSGTVTGRAASGIVREAPAQPARPANRSGQVVGRVGTPPG